MKTIISKSLRLVASCVFACSLSLFSFKAFAIEGLHISVQFTNAVLSWPSDSSETYIIQYRHTLDSADSWTTLADYYPADSNTNKTFFTDTNVDFGSGGSGGGSFTAMATSGNEMSLATSAAESLPPAPMAIPANGSGGAVPLALYPPGFDLTGFLILDPATGETVNGAGYSIKASSPLSASVNGLQTMDSGDGGGLSPTPMGGPVPDGGSGGTTQTPGTGFYRVVRDGAHLIGITNNMVLSGIVSIPVELANASGTVSTMSLTENSSPVGNSIQTAPLNSPLALVVDTTQMSNGVHQISASATWEDTNGGIWEADSPAIFVTISNEISYPNWMPSFGELGNSLVIRATSAHTDTDWYVDVYDSQYYYIGTFGGHTYDGDISIAWDLIGPYGEPHTNDSFFIFKISTQYVDPPTPKTFKQTDPWTTSGGWVFGVQHAFDNLTDHETLYEELSGLLGGVQSYYTVRPTPNGGNPFAISFQDANEVSSWATFKQALYNNGSRNLVYFGHGGPNGLGYNQHNTNTSVTVGEIVNALHTIPAGQTNRHAYRFVFLDGCSTAKGTLPESFGLIHKENVDGIDYYNASMRRSAFCGWSDNKSVGYSFGNTINYDHVSFITLIQTYMLLGDGLKTAINKSANQPNIPMVTTGDFKVFGYWDLHIGTDNN